MDNNKEIFQKLVDEGYEFNHNKYLKDGFELFKKYAGGFIGFFSIVLGVFIVIGSVVPNEWSNIINNLLQPIVTAGLLLVANEVFRGNRPDFSKFFEGLKFYFTLLILSFISGLIIIVGLIFLIVPGLYLAVSYSFANMFVVFFGYDFWTSMELSRKIISKQWWAFFGFMLIIVLINVGGVLACGIGVVFTAPLTLCMTYCAFEDIIGGAIRKYGAINTELNDEQVDN